MFEPQDLDSYMARKYNARRESDWQWIADLGPVQNFIPSGWIIGYFRNPDGKLLVCTAFVFAQEITFQVFQPLEEGKLEEIG